MVLDWIIQSSSFMSIITSYFFNTSGFVYIYSKSRSSKPLEIIFHHVKPAYFNPYRLFFNWRIISRWFLLKLSPWGAWKIVKFISACGYVGTKSIDLVCKLCILYNTSKVQTGICDRTGENVSQKLIPRCSWPACTHNLHLYLLRLP